MNMKKKIAGSKGAGRDLRRPIILTGEPFNWEQAATLLDEALSVDGEIDWQKAMAADPGVMRCPHCQVFLWKEGTEVACPVCGFIFVVKYGGL